MISAGEFLFPSDLHTTEVGISRALIIGSCLSEAYLHSFREYSPETHFDFILFNNVAPLLDRSEEELGSYEFQFIQLPLRSVVTDRLIDFTRFLKPEENAAIIEEAFHLLELMLDTAMVYNSASGLTTFVSNFIVPQLPAVAGLDNVGTELDFRHLVQELNLKLIALLKKYKNTYLIDAENIASVIGKRHFLDDQHVFFSHGAFWYADWSGMESGRRIEPVPPLTETSDLKRNEFIEAVWKHIDYNLRIVRQTDSVKLVIFDLDETLWRGQIAENYEEDYNELYHGWPLGVAEAIHHLRARGILVALCSKNSLEVVESRWHRAAPLHWVKLSDFVVSEIGWDPKAVAIERIMNNVSLTAKNVVFVDDNPVERESVKAAHPRIRVMGSNPFLTRRILLAAAETQPASITSESMQRANMLKKQQTREQERSAMTREEFLARLECRMNFISLNTQDHPQFGRCFELLNKTNQFNTTGRRWSEIEMASFLNRGGRIAAFTVEDRYTPYGLTGVVLLTEDGDIEQFVMSCRVLGMEAETAAIQFISSVIHLQIPNHTIQTRIVETDLNRVCRDVFARSGFESIEDGLWELSRLGAGKVAALPIHIALSADSEFIENIFSHNVSTADRF